MSAEATADTAAEGEDRGEGTSRLAEVTEVDGDDDTSSPGRTSSSADIAQGEDMRLVVDAKGKGKARAQLPEKANTTSSILDFFGKSGGWIISVMSALVLIASLGSSYSTESESGRVHPSTTTTGNPTTTEEEFLSAPSQSSWYHL